MVSFKVHPYRLALPQTRRTPFRNEHVRRYWEAISGSGVTRDDVLDTAYVTFLDPHARTQQPGLGTALGLLQDALRFHHRVPDFTTPVGLSALGRPPSSEEIRFRRAEHLVTRDLRAVVLGVLGTQAYFHAKMARLVRRGGEGNPAFSADPDFEYLASALGRPPKMMPDFGRDYWESRTIVTPYPSPQHEFMLELLNRRLFPAMGRVIMQLKDEPGGSDLLDLARDLQKEFRSGKLWLMEHAGEKGTAPEETLEGALCGLVTENSASSLHILSAWHRAIGELFEELPRVERGLVRSMLSTDYLLQRCALYNLPTLFEQPASMSYEKFLDVFGPEPRGADPVPPGLLKAYFKASGSILAEWKVRGMPPVPVRPPEDASPEELAKARRRNRCGGMIPLEGWNPPSVAAIRVHQRLLEGAGALPRLAPYRSAQTSSVAVLAEEVIDLAPHYLYGRMPWTVQPERRRDVWEPRRPPPPLSERW